MSSVLRQGELNFVPGCKLQTRWGAMEAGMFTLECAGAGLAVAAVAAAGFGGHGVLKPAIWVSVLIVAAAMVLVLAHLGHPERSWRTFRNWRSSWLSRGSMVVSAFVVLGVLYGLVPIESGLAKPLAWLLFAAAAFVTLYPGLVLSASPAIAFWSSGLLPVVSACNGIASGATLLVTLAAALAPVGLPVAQMAAAAAWITGLLAVTIALYLVVMCSRGGTALASATWLMLNDRRLFFGAAVVLGLLVPFLLALWIAVGGPAIAPLAVLAAAARLAGDFSLRAGMLRCGMFSPLL